MADLNCTTHDRLKAHSRHLRFWRLIRPLAEIWAKRAFNYSFDSLKDEEGPFLVLCNHNCDLDPIFVGLALRNQAYFVATENVLHKGMASKLLMRYFCPIIHQKGKMGLRSAKEIHQTLKAGHSVVIFPEGNRSFTGVTGDIPAVTAKLAKKAKKLVCLRIEGGYLSQPRWSTTRRCGQLHCTRVAVYDEEQLSLMSDNEVAEAIRQDLHEDAYARQEQIARETGTPLEFTGENLALGLESTLFMCPECGRIGSLRSEGNTFACTGEDCPLTITYHPTGFLTIKSGYLLPSDVTYQHTDFLGGGQFATVAGWDAWQHWMLTRNIACSLNEKELFSDEVVVRAINEEHQVTSITPGTLKAYAHKAIFTPQNKNQEGADSSRTITPDELEGLAIFSRNTLIAHIGKPAQHFEISGNLRFNALKYWYLFQAQSASN